MCPNPPLSSTSEMSSLCQSTQNLSISAFCRTDSTCIAHGDSEDRIIPRSSSLPIFSVIIWHSSGENQRHLSATEGWDSSMSGGVNLPSGHSCTRFGSVGNRFLSSPFQCPSSRPHLAPEARIALSGSGRSLSRPRFGKDD